MKRHDLTLFLLLLALAAVVPAVAQEPTNGEEPDQPLAASTPGEEEEADEMASFFATTTVTATGREVDAFTISTPVAVIPSAEIERRLPNTSVDLLRMEPGVDVQGVGLNQPRPIIRGQRGLRVLFLENGLRMNNARRQTDFGEIPGLVATDNVEAVEVVRGPASVLYGTDAIGGVLNLVTRAPSFASGWRAGGGLRYGSAGDQVRLDASFERSWERFSLRLGGNLREADDYESASGRFGAIALDSEVSVVDTGLDDETVFGHLGYQLADGHQLFVRTNRYRADETGFGFVEPDLINPFDPFRIRILYPFQDFDRYTAGYYGLGGGWADSVEAQLYYQSNERQLRNDIDIDIGPVAPGAPSSTIEADTLNFTDLDTLGARFEATRAAGERHLLTWGAELYEDDSFNTDASVTTSTIRLPFPPFEIVDVMTDEVANAPNATNSSYGIFLQDEIAATERLSLTLGARYQNVSTRAEPTPGWDVSGLDFDDDSLVGALSLTFSVNEHLNVVGSYGTAFRAPNIIERLFNGLTPEGIGFQVLNSDLTSEESESIDFGLKYRRRNAVFEAIYFVTDVDDGIIQYFLTPEERAALPLDIQEQIRQAGVRFVVQQRNIDRLRYEGVEVIVGYRFANGLVAGGNYTHIDAERRDSTNPPTGDTVSDKVNAYLRYEPRGQRYWVEYRVRYNGEQRANLDPGEPVPPVGEILPSFDVHTIAGGVTLFEGDAWRHELGIVIDNVTDELYAEFSNAAFFRPQPKRNVMVSYRVKL